MSEITPRDQFHLMRTWYKTDADPTEPEYFGAFSQTIPGTALMGGSKIVNIDWSNKGWVEVTFLLYGPGHSSDAADYPLNPYKPTP